MTIEIAKGNKHIKVEWPRYFKEQGFHICYTKDQFDYLCQMNYDTDYAFFDYKKRIIYLHEYHEAICTGDCDYAWDSTSESKKKVFKVSWVIPPCCDI